VRPPSSSSSTRRRRQLNSGSFQHDWLAGASLESDQEFDCATAREDGCASIVYRTRIARCPDPTSQNWQVVVSRTAQRSVWSFPCAGRAGVHGAVTEHVLAVIHSSPRVDWAHAAAGLLLDMSRWLRACRNMLQLALGCLTSSPFSSSSFCLFLRPPFSSPSPVSRCRVG